MSTTLLLDPDTWDLLLDASRNIAVGTAPYALAQDAASSIRTFLGEVYYDTTQGVPYWSNILGHRPPIELLKDELVAAAKKVPGVIAARVFLLDITDRRVTGQVQITDSANVVTIAGF